MKKKPPRRHDARPGGRAPAVRGGPQLARGPVLIDVQPAPGDGQSRRTDPQGSPHALQPLADAQGMGVVLHDPALLDGMRERWLAADWPTILALPDDTVRQHPDRAQLSALRAVAALQTGDRRAARVLADRALAWGCDRVQLGSLLVTGMRHTLGRASHAARREARGDAHFEKSVAQARLSSEVRRLAQQRADGVAEEIKAAIGAARTLRRGHALPAAATAPGWLTGLADQCMRADDVHQAMVHAVDALLSATEERARFLMLMADRFLARDDRMTALHLLGRVRELQLELDEGLRSELGRRLVAVDAAHDAVDMVVEAAVAASASDPAVAAALRASYDKMRSGASVVVEHGHDLVLGFLDAHVAALQQHVGARWPTLVEIGTTREDVAGQGSTRKLAQYCVRNRLRFITVDMDPHNTEMARKTFAALGADFEAVTMKGEDFLARFEGTPDLVFLDAYDFDHGKHSELRQSRYERFLGSRIDEEACHRMHLDCAQSLAAKMPAWGAVFLDDTWVEDGRWVAKGTLAMPYLLANGFKLVESRNRAATMVRGHGPWA